MPVTDCHRCGTMVHYDALLSEPRCTPCALIERDAALAVLRQLVAADDELRAARDEYDGSLAMDRLDAALAAARTLLAPNGAGAETGGRNGPADAPR